MSNKILKDKQMNNILILIKKDLTLILICLIALAACVYTLMTVGAYQDKINDHWMQQWDEICNDAPIGYDPIGANFTFNLRGKYNGTN